MALDPVRARQKIALDPLPLSVPVGSRIAYLYQGDAGRTRFAPFIAAGLANRDKCVIVTDHAGKLAFELALANLGIDVASCEANQALLVITEQVPIELIEKIGQPITDDARRRFRSIRCLNDSCCAIAAGYTARDLLRLEIKGHLLENTFPTTFICQYDLGIVKRERIAAIISAHQYTVSASHVEHNPDRRSLGQIIFDGMDEQVRALTGLQDLSLQLASCQSLDQTLNAVMDAAVAICRTDRVAISYFDEFGELKLVTHRGLSQEYVRERRLKYDDPSVAALISTGEPLILEDIDLARLSPNYDRWRREGVKSIVTLPLISKGEIFGVIGTGSGLVRHYSQTEVDAMAILAAQAGAAITNGRLFEQLTQANHAKDEFLATLSHELRTPLTPILGWIRILSRFSDADPLLREGFEVIERNARQQATLINDLLDLTRIDSGKIELSREPTDLARLMQTAANLVRPLAENRAISIEIDGLGEPVICNVDPVRIQQVVLNLLSNAVKFTPEGGRVSVSLTLPGDLADEGSPAEVAIAVVDTGIGISPEFLPYVFDRFTQANGGISRRYGGLGLGLAITRALVHMHGGTLKAHSEGIDRGSRFTVLLPSSVLASQTAPDSKSESEAGRDRSGRPGDSEEGPPSVTSMRSGQPNTSRADIGRARIGGNDISAAPAREPETLGLRLLVVEDSADTLNMLTTWLKGYGCDVQTANSAAEALTVAAHYLPNLIISDIGMPDVDGYEFIRELRRTPGLERIPAIALTGYARDEDREMALAAGYDAHIAKPAQMEQLLALVKRLTASPPSIQSY